MNTKELILGWLKNGMPTFVVASLIAIVVGLIGVIYFYDQNPFDDALFDGAVWRTEATNTTIDNLRGPMTEDLRKRFLRSGSSKQEILKLLGPPDAADREGFSSYWIGAWGRDRIEFDSLNLAFDDQGCLIASSIEQH